MTRDFRLWDVLAETHVLQREGVRWPGRLATTR